MANKTKKKKKRTSSIGASSRLARYWNESSRPLMSLVFVAPMIAVYEGGLVVLGPRAMRNGADVWLRQLLELLGFSQYFLLPVLTCALLVGWHHLNRDKWSLCGTYFYGMIFESVAFAALLLVAAQAQQNIFAAIETTSAPVFAPVLAVHAGKPFGQLAAFCGAGIYEELLFRLMLLPGIAALLRLIRTPRRTSWIIAIILSSLAFSAAHYQLDLMIGNWHLVTSYGDTFDWTSFLFRFGAGIFFALLLLFRGFGIAAGAHALYDILISLPS